VNKDFLVTLWVSVGIVSHVIMYRHVGGFQTGAGIFVFCVSLPIAMALGPVMIPIAAFCLWSLS
jgi:hypothetical protein